MAFVKALTEVTTDVDDDEDPLDSIKDYGKDLVKALSLNGIGEASKIAKIAKKAWRVKKPKLKVQPSPIKLWGKRMWQGSPLPIAAAPAAPPPPPVVTPAYTPRPPCSVCGRTGHNEATCFIAHPELRVVKPI